MDHRLKALVVGAYCGISVALNLAMTELGMGAAVLNILTQTVFRIICQTIRRDVDYTQFNYYQ